MTKTPAPAKNIPGIFISHGIKLELHEISTINFLVNQGKTVEQILPSNTPHNQQPDIFMDSLAWEIKSPTSDSPKSLEQLFYHASRQSPNIIFDLRRLKHDNVKSVILLEKLLHSSRKVKNLIIITKPASFKLLQHGRR